MNCSTSPPTNALLLGEQFVGSQRKGGKKGREVAKQQFDPPGRFCDAAVGSCWGFCWTPLSSIRVYKLSAHRRQDGTSVKTQKASNNPPFLPYFCTETLTVLTN